MLLEIQNIFFLFFSTSSDRTHACQISIYFSLTCFVSRFVQHTARHERLDTLCGDEFQGFRGVPCGREECELNTLHNSSRFNQGPGLRLFVFLHFELIFL